MKNTICDWCGRKSPDEKGRHIANRWYIVSRSRGIHLEDKTEDVCDECYRRGKKAVTG